MEGTYVDKICNYDAKQDQLFPPPNKYISYK